MRSARNDEEARVALPQGPTGLVAGIARMPDSDTAQTGGGSNSSAKTMLDLDGGADHKTDRSSVVFAPIPDKAYFR
jgi:hypothetical protein